MSADCKEPAGEGVFLAPSGKPLFRLDQKAIEEDPVKYMATLLDRAADWLEDAVALERVREFKAIALGLQTVVQEMDVAEAAQLSATEIVRRCERRIGQLVKKGQESGDIRGPGKPSTAVQVSPDDFFSGARVKTETYALADIPSDQFDEILKEARFDGNLSRRNVVRLIRNLDTPTEPVRWSTCPRNIQEAVADFLHRDGYLNFTYNTEDELDHGWKGRAFVDPPRIEPHVLGRWILKALSELRDGHVNEVLFWLPAPQASDWFVGVTLEPCFIVFPIGKQGGAAVIIAYWGERRDDFENTFGYLGPLGLFDPFE